MAGPTFHILALETEPERSGHLEAMLREHVSAQVEIAHSGAAVLQALSRQTPDLILTSALASPSDEAMVLSYLRDDSGAPDVPVLVVPPAVAQEGASPDDRRQLFAWLRRSNATWPLYNADAVASRIKDALADARTARDRRRRAARVGPLVSAIVPVELRDPAAGPSVLRAPRRRAHRWLPRELPWICGVDTHRGVDVRIVNVSRTGLLVVSSMKMAPDSTLQLRLHGLEQKITVPARVVRSEVASVDPRGVTYQAAASFAGELNLIPELPGTLKPSTDAQGLANLLERANLAISNGEDVEAVRAMFEHELGLLLPAHDVAVRRKPVPTPEGESVYFQVPGNGLSILQVTFPPGHAPSAEDFALLKAAAAAVGLFQSRLRWRNARNSW